MRDREISSKARNTHTKACNTSKLFIFHRVSNAAVKQTETERAGTYSAHRRRHDYTFRFLSSPLALSTITANSSIAEARTTSSSSVRFGLSCFFFRKKSQKFAFLLRYENQGETDPKNTGVARELLVRLRRIRASGCSAALTKTTGRAQRRRRRTERQKERQKERKEVQYKKIKK